MVADIEKNDSAVALAVATELDHYRNNRPFNTTRTYVPKQKEWDVSDLPLLRLIGLATFSGSFALKLSAIAVMSAGQ